MYLNEQRDERHIMEVQLHFLIQRLSCSAREEIWSENFESDVER